MTAAVEIWTLNKKGNSITVNGDRENKSGYVFVGDSICVNVGGKEKKFRLEMVECAGEDCSENALSGTGYCSECTTNLFAQPNQRAYEQLMDDVVNQRDLLEERLMFTSCCPEDAQTPEEVYEGKEENNVVLGPLKIPTPIVFKVGEERVHCTATFRYTHRALQEEIERAKQTRLREEDEEENENTKRRKI